MSGDTLVVSGCFPDPEELAAFCAVSGAKKLRGRSQTLEAAAKEDFAPWYCEISHKLRHRQGALLGVRAAGKMAATAGIYHQNRKAALIGSVATDPAFRRRGYASALVFSLADRARQKGRIPFVICQNPEAAQVYEQIGFTLWGEEWLCCRDKTAG